MDLITQHLASAFGLFKLIGRFFSWIGQKMPPRPHRAPKNHHFSFPLKG